VSKSALSAPWSQSDSPDSMSVRRPVHSRYPAVAGLPPSEQPLPSAPCNNATPFASIRLGLELANHNPSCYDRLTLKNVCYARHTTSASTWSAKGGRLWIKHIHQHTLICQVCVPFAPSEAGVGGIRKESAFQKDHNMKAQVEFSMKN